MVLPFTVCTSYVYLHSRPSARVLLACALVTMGFVVGVWLDGTEVSMFGVSCGVFSSVITATHSVIIKKSLEVVKGSAINMSWYTNFMSAIALAPLVILGGEVPAVMSLFFDDVAGKDGAMSPFATFAWGTAITVGCPLGF
jgi:solute carrier family 35 (GDP-fucose transporter), member C1